MRISRIQVSQWATAQQGNFLSKNRPLCKFTFKKSKDHAKGSVFILLINSDRYVFAARLMKVKGQRFDV